MVFTWLMSGAAAKTWVEGRRRPAHRGEQGWRLCKPPNGAKCVRSNSRLQSEDLQRRPSKAKPLHPLDDEERDDGQLADHQQLAKMGRRAFVGRIDHAVDSRVTDDDRESDKRHRHGDRGTRDADRDRWCMRED